MASAYMSSESLIELHDFHEGYYEYGALNKNSATKREFLKNLTFLESHLTPDERNLFDIGYGNGFFLAVAQQRGWNVDGIDTSIKNMETAKKRFGLSLRQGYLNNLDIKIKADAVVMLDVVEHIDNPHQFIREASALLKPGGLLLIAVPNEHSLLQLIAALFYRISRGKLKAGIKKVYILEHVCYYAPETLEKLVCVNGFESIAHYFSNTDLRKYHLNFFERAAGYIIIGLQTLFKRKNRLIIVARKKE